MSTKFTPPVALGFRACGACGAGARAGPLRTGTRSSTELARGAPGSAARNTAETLQHNKSQAGQDGLILPFIISIITVIVSIIVLNYGSNCSVFILWFKGRPGEKSKEKNITRISIIFRISGLN